MGKKMQTMDGNTAAAHVAYAFTEVAGIYPITPSSTMAEYVDEWASKGRKNIFGQPVKVVEMQSEGGAAGVVHGSLQAGALTTTFTASQGLLLMIPNMYKIAGELLPGVFHVSARALASHALSIFGDHSDVMACRQTGFALLASGGIQEVMDIAGVAHLSALKGRVPFVHFFDGFRSSHEIQKIEVMDYDDLKGLVDVKALKEFRERALNPNRPVLRGTAQNPDIFFQARESSNTYYENIPAVVEEYMEKISELTGRKYGLFNYYGAPDAERVIIAMGSVTETIDETVDYLISKGEKVGVLKVHLYRPFSIEHFLKEMPETVKKIAVLDRTKEPGSLGEPLYLDVCAVYKNKCDAPQIVGGRYGLGSKDTTPEQIVSVFDNLKSDEPKNGFTIGIIDDVTHTSLPLGEEVDTTPEGTVSCKFWGLGSDGTVGANKNAIKIIGDNTDKYVQAYFSYDSKKSGGITVSHLRFGDKPIKSTYLIKKANFLACHNPSYVHKYDMVSDIKKGGTFLLNCGWNMEELESNLPAKTKRYLAKNDIKFYTIDGVKIARDIGLGGRTNMVMMAAFFNLANIIPIEEAVKHMENAIVKSYGKFGDKVVAMNKEAVQKGIELLHKVNVPASWADAKDAPKADVKDRSKFLTDFVDVINAQDGDSLPVSAFKGMEDGTFPQALSKFEKRGIAPIVPEWIPENCIQCNQCSYVCPHAVIRPFLLNKEEEASKPADFNTLKANGKGFEDYTFRIQVSLMDCVGCGSCADVCPAKNKALVMKEFDTQHVQEKNWEYAMSLSKKPNPMKKNTVKGSQFETPYLEFSGACPGCGETPYLKLVTQFFGDRMMIANATGCSSIWGGSAPSTPYAVNDEGKGPAWANSLFEDNAEYGLGMYHGVKQIQEKIQELNTELMSKDVSDDIKAACQKWIDTRTDGEASIGASADLVSALESINSDDAAVKAISAGADIVLMPEDFIEAFEGIYEAVKNGTLSETRIDQSVLRILSLKEKYGFLN